MPRESEVVLASDRTSVTSVFRADRYHQLASTGVEESLAAQLADVQARGWSAMIDGFADPEYRALVIDDDLVAGAVIGGGTRRRIAWIGVHPAQRRRGYGRAVLAAICAEADRDQMILDLQVERTNLGAIALYAEAGFSAAGPDQSTDLFLAREPRRSAS
ncbi:GNAT family N-acetyltransferase [Nocardioides sp. Bht2]|uniref:GNAT family N-acetyltransferase n=1 Tax=Nocardioides sp. Bht2 TaxID=3392297 RepID=UPI0039B67324